MAEMRWLDDGEQEIWRSYIYSSKMLFGLLDRELQRSNGIPHAYYEILVLLSEAPDRAMRMSELAEITQSLPSRMSHAVSRLEDMGWVRRDNCPSDRRGWFAVLTDEGVGALEKAAPSHVDSVRRHLFDQLTGEELAQLGAISKKLFGHLAASEGSVCPSARRSASPGEREAGPNDSAGGPGTVEHVGKAGKAGTVGTPSTSSGTKTSERRR